MASRLLNSHGGQKTMKYLQNSKGKSIPTQNPYPSKLSLKRPRTDIARQARSWQVYLPSTWKRRTLRGKCAAQEVRPSPGERQGAPSGGRRKPRTVMHPRKQPAENQTNGGCEPLPLSSLRTWGSCGAQPSVTYVDSAEISGVPSPVLSGTCNSPPRSVLLPWNLGVGHS